MRGVTMDSADDTDDPEDELNENYGVLEDEY